MQPHKNSARKTNPGHHRKNKSRRQPNRGQVTASPPVVSVQAEEWGATAEPWPGTIDESDVSKEIISVWRQNVYAAENGGEPQKMEDLYNRLDTEREKWNERLHNPLTWDWGGGGADELNDWASQVKEGTGWGEYHPDDFNKWTNHAVYEPRRWGEHQANSDKTPDGPSNARSTEQTPPPLPQLVSRYAEKLKAGGRQRSYAFAQLSAEAKAEKIREVAYQLKAFKKH